MKQLLKLAINDFKLIFRDPSLRIFLLLPGLIFLVINIALPFLISKYGAVSDYVPYVLITATIETTQMFGIIYSMVLIEEKETEVAKTYGVLPISKEWFILFRLLIPSLITVAITWLLLSVQPFYQLETLSTLLFSLLTGLLVPVYILGISILSKNKIAGLIWIKVFNLFVVLPVAAFFTPLPFNHLFGIIPTHWSFQALFSLIEGNDYFMNNLLIGAAYLSVILVVIVRRFAKFHFA